MPDRQLGKDICGMRRSKILALHMLFCGVARRPYAVRGTLEANSANP